MRGGSAVLRRGLWVALGNELVPVETDPLQHRRQFVGRDALVILRGDEAFETDAQVEVEPTEVLRVDVLAHPAPVEHGPTSGVERERPDLLGQPIVGTSLVEVLQVCHGEFGTWPIAFK